MSKPPATLAHTRDNLWYGVGTKVDQAMTVEEALVLGGLDWEVEMRPAGFMKSDGRFETIPEKYAVVRKDTDTWMGQVGRNYKLFQNLQAFAFADGLVDGGLLIDSCGTYANGRKVFLTAKLPDTLLVGGEDAHELYLFMTTSHDGRSSIQVALTPIRMACTNMTQLMLREAVTRWSIRHTTSAEGKLQEARETLELTFKGMDAFDVEMQKLMDLSMTELDMAAAVEKVLPKTPRVQGKIDHVVSLFNESPTIPEQYRGTRYAGLQAFTEWLDWGRDVRTPEARFQVSFDGYGARQRNELYRLLQPA